MINLSLNSLNVSSYTSNSQKTRIRTESWVQSNLFCSNCGSCLASAKNNAKGCDFVCRNCTQEYELKSKEGAFGKKIVNGAYDSLISRVTSITNPNLFLLNYNSLLHVRNFIVVPRHFFTTSIIEKRKPLSGTARRAGWIGCNILIGDIPELGKIYYIRDGKIEPKQVILQNWQKANFLSKSHSFEAKGWLLETIKCIEKLGVKNFSLQDLYNFENELSLKFPNNNHIKDKIRQQLQILRDNDYLRFTSRGQYEVS